MTFNREIAGEAIAALNQAIDRQDRDGCYDALTPLIVTEAGRCTIAVSLCVHLGTRAREQGGVQVNLDGHDAIVEHFAAMVAAGGNNDLDGICLLFHKLTAVEELELIGFIVELTLEAHQ